MAAASRFEMPAWAPAPASSCWRPPVLVLQAATTLAWIMYAAMLAGAQRAAGAASDPVWWCMPGMTLDRSSASAPLATVTAVLPMWSLMAAAMTLPAAVPAVQHVAVNSFRSREWGAVTTFVAIYLGVWLAFGVAASAALALLPSASPDAVLMSVLTLAAVYELTTWKHRALNRCHRSSPLRSRGPRATAAVARFAWINGSGCVASCWAAMLVMLVAPTARFGWALSLSAVMASEKLTRRPRRARRRVGALFATAAIGAALGLAIA